jgi:hypothetical protein
MQLTCIGGWGVAPEVLRPFASRLVPRARQIFLPPTQTAAKEAAASDWVVGWSLGAWRILDAAARGVVFRNRVALLAPFVAFASDFGLGGRIPLAQIHWLRRWMQRQPVAALQDFYQRAGLPETLVQLPYPLEDLLEGLDRLVEPPSPALRTFAAGGLPERWSAVIGTEDFLLDAPAVCKALPGCVAVPRTGHSWSDLADALVEESNAV